MKGQVQLSNHVEQAKSLDIVARRSSFVEKSPQDILDEVIDIFIGFIE